MLFVPQAIQDQLDQKWLKSEAENMSAKIKDSLNHKIHYKVHLKSVIKMAFYISGSQTRFYRSPGKLKKYQCPTMDSDLIDPEAGHTYLCQSISMYWD